MEHISFFAGVIASAACFALLEIQIEGDRGWAERLPTWKVENRWTKLFFSNRPLTGYHLYAHLFFVLVAHAPLWLGLAPLHLRAEARIWAFIVFFWLFEDFLWFVFNPAFGIRKFKSEFIWWHAPTWWWIMPRDYWVFAPLAVLLYFLSL